MDMLVDRQQTRICPSILSTIAKLETKSGKIGWRQTENVRPGYYFGIIRKQSCLHFFKMESEERQGLIHTMHSDTDPWTDFNTNIYGSTGTHFTSVPISKGKPFLLSKIDQKYRILPQRFHFHQHQVQNNAKFQ